ncbi:thymopoietin a isoform X2 [Siniperca chuatsi]|uniref:thymopoietin a isoform X2 n=1 Tax=Siniperca chuatsi TaxID=119488 RepID=UPI001CE0D2CD|nr:thymopoietin a isoform X2 [Siniperca chuatsi]
MPEYLDDPSVLTKDKLKSELLAHNVELPSGNPTKDVYVQLYLNNLTVQNNKHVTATTLDAFSSDEELPPPVVSSRSRSSGRKATRKTDKVRPDELDVTVLTDQGLKDELLKHGVDAGPIVASTRKLYEKKLQKLLDDGPAQPPLPQLVLTEIQVKHNGNSDSDLYSDKEDAPEPVAEPEPAPVVERPLRSLGKTPVTTRTRSSQHHTIVPEDLRPVLKDQVQLESNRRVHHRLDSPARTEPPSISSRPAQLQEEELGLSLPKPSKDSSHKPVALLNTALLEVEKIAASDQTPKAEENAVLKELFHNDINSPTGITATCRRPIRGAAGRPVKSSDLWNDENSLFSPKTTKTTSSLSSSYTESRTVNRITSLPPSTSSTSTSSFSTYSSRPLSAAPLAGQTKAAQRSMSLWIKLFLLAIVAAFLFLVYQAMETNTINPFADPDTAVVSGSTA